jgi:hypothetical protein
LVLELAFAALCFALFVVISAHAVVSRAFRARAHALGARLALPPGAAAAVAQEDLPPLVRAFAERAGASAGTAARTATFTQAAELQLKPGAPFARFAAWQVVGLRRSGFLWEARQDKGPFTWLRVIDAYVDGVGRLEARLLGAIPVAEMTGPELALSEAGRYLAELAWAPDAILLNPDLRWTMAGSRMAEVALETPAGPVRARFSFDEAGDILSVSVPDRPAKMPDGTLARMELRGTYSDYRRIGPRRVPARAEVGYVYPSGYNAYFRCELTGYELAD